MYINSSDHALVRLKHRQMCHVGGRLVGIVRGDDQLLLGAARDDALGRLHRDAFDRWHIARRARRSRGDPAAQHLIMRVAVVQLASAAVRHRADGFEQNQAVFRRCREDAPATRFLSERVVIEVVVKSEQRKLKAVLPARFAVARASVATEAGEDRLHIALEGDGSILRAVDDGERRASMPSSRTTMARTVADWLTIPSALTATTFGVAIRIGRRRVRQLPSLVCDMGYL